tara:strand:- start:148 stop:849 length:702 start_codon:yes stop_codon:yes gene_type:complete
MSSLTKYPWSKYSQNNEDGVLQEIFERQGIEKGVFVDVGAWDGVYLSNTKLLLEKGWRGLCIEGDSQKSQESQQNLAGHDAICINSFVTCEDDSTNVNFHLKAHNIKEDFEFFTIDIDSIDWWVWKNLNYQPQVVLVEYNSNHSESCVMRYEPGYRHLNNIRYYGASAPAFLELGALKGYDLVWLNHVNMAFVRCDINKIPSTDLFSYPYHQLWGQPTDIPMMPLEGRVISEL